MLGAASSQAKLGLVALLAVGFVDLAVINLVLAPKLADELEATEPVGSVASSAEPSVGTEPAQPTARAPSAEPGTHEPVASATTGADEPAASGAREPEPTSGQEPRPAGRQVAAAKPEPVQREPEPVQKEPEPEPVQLTPVPDLMYGTAATSLTAESRRVLRGVRRQMRQRKDVKLVARGHADRRGGPEYNQNLALRRAEKVVRYLVALGISRDRLRAESAGADEPVDPRDVPEAWAKNRRVQLMWQEQ